MAPKPIYTQFSRDLTEEELLNQLIQFLTEAGVEITDTDEDETEEEGDEIET